jgi:hypothetical protein
VVLVSDAVHSLEIGDFDDQRVAGLDQLMSTANCGDRLFAGVCHAAELFLELFREMVQGDASMDASRLGVVSCGKYSGFRNIFEGD